MNTIYKKILFNIVPFHSLRDETLSIYPLDNTSETEIKLGQVHNTFYCFKFENRLSRDDYHE